MNTHEIVDTAKSLVAADKGLLAMDESNPTCNRRFAKLGIPQTGQARRAWRESIVTTPGLGENISGAILYDETIREQLCQSHRRRRNHSGNQGRRRRQRDGGPSRRENH